MERSHAQSALALHERLADGQPGNVVWSPYSVASALGLVAAGARGRTFQELAAALVPGTDPAAEPAGTQELAQLGALLAAAARPEDADAAVANALWLDRRLRFREDYQDAVLGWPGGAVHTVDFKGDPDGSRQKINDDVTNVTRGLVRDLLAAGMVTRETAAVIVNALYLKVAWQHPFEPAATAPAPFHAPSGTRPVPTMRQRESLRYAAAGGWRMVTLPTVSREVVVDVLLPDRDGDRPTVDTLLALRAAVRPTKVDLTLPVLRVAAGAVLNAHLRQLGVVAAFQPGAADFSGMVEASGAVGEPEVWVDTVVHKAVLRVDEQGFEGAAATAVVMRLASLDLGRPVPFHVDRPFLLLVRHRGTGAWYFLGQVAEP